MTRFINGKLSIIFSIITGNKTQSYQENSFASECVLNKINLFKVLVALSFLELRVKMRCKTCNFELLL